MAQLAAALFPAPQEWSPALADTCRQAASATSEAAPPEAAASDAPEAVAPEAGASAAPEQPWVCSGCGVSLSIDATEPWCGVLGTCVLASSGPLAKGMIKTEPAVSSSQCREGASMSPQESKGTAKGKRKRYTLEQVSDAPPWARKAMEAADTPMSAAETVRRLTKEAANLAPPDTRKILDVVHTSFRGAWADKMKARNLLDRLIVERVVSKHGSKGAGTAARSSASGHEEVNGHKGTVKVKAEPQDANDEEPKEATTKPKLAANASARKRAIKAAEASRVAVKKEPGEKFGFAQDPRKHYRFQVGFIDKVVEPPWRVCFGALGSGIIGVRSEGSTEALAGSSASSSAPASASHRTSGAGAQQPAAEEDQMEEEPSASAGPFHIPGDATIVLLLNAPAAPLQARNGKAMGDYRDGLDVEKRTLHWSSQRRDRQSKRLEAIVSHQRSGGRVIAAVRAGPDAGGQDFKLLGQVSNISDVKPQQFLIKEGDHVLQERGTHTYHKYITASCLNDGLRSGIGLAALRYPLPAKLGTPRWCHACCYEAPSCQLHFDTLSEEGVAAYGRPFGTIKVERGVKREPDKSIGAEVPPIKSADEQRPTKRFRGKQPMIKEEPKANNDVACASGQCKSPVSVKTEPVEAAVEVRESEVARAARIVGAPHGDAAVMEQDSSDPKNSASTNTELPMSQVKMSDDDNEGVDITMVKLVGIKKELADDAATCIVSAIRSVTV